MVSECAIDCCQLPQLQLLVFIGAVIHRCQQLGNHLSTLRRDEADSIRINEVRTGLYQDIGAAVASSTPQTVQNTPSVAAVQGSTS